MNKNSPFQILRIGSTALLLLVPVLCAAQVYKCVEDGRAIFQSEPCKNGGTLMHLNTKPSAQNDDAAKARAE